MGISARATVTSLLVAFVSLFWGRGETPLPQARCPTRWRSQALEHTRLPFQYMTSARIAYYGIDILYSCIPDPSGPRQVSSRIATKALTLCSKHTHYPSPYIPYTVLPARSTIKLSKHPLTHLIAILRYDLCSLLYSIVF